VLFVSGTETDRASDVVVTADTGTGGVSLGLAE